MPAYLISGPSGSGKSTVGRELQKRGFAVIETDFEPNFSGWFNNQTGKRVVDLPPQPFTKEWFGAHSWLWDPDVVEKLIATGGSEPVFFCGGAYNEHEFYDLFDLRFALYADSDTLVKRLRSREPETWVDGSPALLKLLDWNSRFVDYSTKSGALIIDSTAPTENVADDILKRINT
jgi:hypothetical protein